MKKLIFLFCITFGLAQNNGIRSLNGSLNNSQRLTVDTTSSATFRWGLSNGVHTLYLPYRIVNPSTGSFSWRKSGSSVVTDSIRFIQGSGVSLTQTGYTLTISASGGGSVGNADSLGSLPASDWFLRSDTIGLKSRLLKNADSTTMRNYSNALYSLKAGSSSIVTVGTITSGTWNGTAIDTAYTNAIATITSKTGLITTTRYNTKDFQLDLDTTGTTGLRSKYVPYSGANTAVNLGSQTFTTTGAGSFGALSGTTITASSYVDGDDSVFTSAADSWMGAESGGITPRLAFVKASGFGPELRFLSSSASLFTVRRVTGGTLLAPSASTVDMQIGATGNVAWSGGNHSGMGTISSGSLTTTGSLNINRSSTAGFALLNYQTASTTKWNVGTRNNATESMTWFYSPQSVTPFQVDTNGTGTFRRGVVAQTLQFGTGQNTSLTSFTMSSFAGTTRASIDTSGRHGIGTNALTGVNLFIKNNPLDAKIFSAQNSRAIEIAKIDSNGSLGGTKYLRDSVAFSGTGQKIAVYIQGATKNDYYVATAGGVAGDGTAYTAPSANDILMVYPKTDSLIIYRPASGTSGLKVYYMRMN